MDGVEGLVGGEVCGGVEVHGTEGTGVGTLAVVTEEKVFAEMF